MRFAFIFALYPHFALANISTPNPSTSLYINNIKKPTAVDIKQAKYLEDYYWAFRNQNYNWLGKSAAGFKPSTSDLSVYKTVISDGIKISNSLQKNIEYPCNDIPLGFDNISKKYYELFKNICIQDRISSVLDPRKSLTDADRNFLLQHDYLLTSNRFKGLMVSKLKKLNSNDANFFSDYIKDFIYNHKELPRIEFMEFLKVDTKITQFIQENGLFDKQDSKYFTDEFNRLISDFKDTFLDGDQEMATESLEKAVQFYNNNEERINNAKAWKLFFTNGMTLARTEEAQDLALSLFKYSEKVAEEENLYDSKFQALLTYYQSNQLGEALSFIDKNNFVSDFAKLTPQLRFWTALVFDKRNEKVMAKDLYLKLISLSPLSYYSILSLKQLRDINSSYTSEIIVKSDTFKGIDEVKLSEIASRKIYLFKVFSQANSSFLTSLQARDLRLTSAKKLFEVEEDQKMSIKKNFLLSFFSAEGEYLLSFKQAYSALRQGDIELTPTVLNSLFPKTYGNIIKDQNSPIDYRLILSLIRQESAFNKKAKSVVGARGLMQLMPATARMFKRQLKTEQLFNPNLNIEIGVQFLERLVKRYDGNLMFTLSAYNAGMGNVAKWMKSIPFGDDILLNVEMIPFSETRKYVKLIYRNLFFYKYLDQDPAHLDLALNESFHVGMNEAKN